MLDRRVSEMRPSGVDSWQMPKEPRIHKTNSQKNKGGGGPQSLRSEGTDPGTSYRVHHLSLSMNRKLIHSKCVGNLMVRGTSAGRR